MKSTPVDELTFLRQYVTAPDEEGKETLPQKEIEVILTRHLASYLSFPIFVVDPQGTLIYYNDPAEKILGRRFQETGEMPASEWSTVFIPRDRDGTSLSPDELPLIVATSQRRAAHRAFWIQTLDGEQRYIEVTAFPLLGAGERHVGAVAMFWEAAA